MTRNPTTAEQAATTMQAQQEALASASRLQAFIRLAEKKVADAYSGAEEAEALAASARYDAISAVALALVQGAMRDGGAVAEDRETVIFMRLWAALAEEGRTIWRGTDDKIAAIKAASEGERKALVVAYVRTKGGLLDARGKALGEKPKMTKLPSVIRRYAPRVAQWARDNAADTLTDMRLAPSPESAVGMWSARIDAAFGGFGALEAAFPSERPTKGKGDKADDATLAFGAGEAPAPVEPVEVAVPTAEAVMAWLAAQDAETVRAVVLAGNARLEALAVPAEAPAKPNRRRAA